jgi:hypothetical protein
MRMTFLLLLKKRGREVRLHVRVDLWQLVALAWLLGLLG